MKSMPNFNESTFKNCSYSSVSKYNLVEYKIALDEAIADILTYDFKYERSRILSDFKLFVEFVACFCCLSATTYAGYSGLHFLVTRPLLISGLLGYFVIISMSKFIKEYAFVGKKNENNLKVVTKTTYTSKDTLVVVFKLNEQSYEFKTGIGLFFSDKTGYIVNRNLYNYIVEKMIIVEKGIKND